MAYKQTVIGAGVDKITQECNCCLCQKPTKSHEKNGKFYCHACWVKFDNKPPTPFPKKTYSGKRRKHIKSLPPENKKIKVRRRVV